MQKVKRKGKVTSIGRKARVTNKHKKRAFKPYAKQGRV